MKYRRHHNDENIYCSFKEIVTEEFEIEAENENDAIEKGIRKYKACEWVLEPGELEEATIAVIDEKGDCGEWETIFD